MHIIPRIDYQKLADAQEYYPKHGFLEISVPWILSYQAYNATRPPNRREFYTLDGYLNASAEQGFLDLLLSGQELTKHLSITSCFRDEPTQDDLHHRYFVKAELIDMNVSKENLAAMISCAQDFFNRYVETDVTQTDEAGEMFDIIDAHLGIELGSYGIRSYKEHAWIYGTGLALPRLDTVIRKLNTTKG